MSNLAIKNNDIFIGTKTHHSKYNGPGSLLLDKVPDTVIHTYQPHIEQHMPAGRRGVAIASYPVTKSLICCGGTLHTHTF